MLRGAIADAVGGSAVAIEIIEAAGIDADCRGETLVLKDYVALANAFAKRKST
jgi:16S rRNA A1518/A1519 N6-dimethyltransferase RsmA/KsgA/DIM1 with predicted DNA glycosylase/AP lyase activity